MQPLSITSLFAFVASIAAVTPAAAQTTELVSAVSPTQQGNGSTGSARVSGNGRFVAFSSAATNLVGGDVNNAADVFVKDLATGAVERVSTSSTGVGGNATSLSPSISRDGRFVAFTSASDNLVPGDTNGFDDVFLKDRQTGAMTRVSVTATGAELDADSFGASVDDSGNWVAFVSAATNLTATAPSASQVYLKSVGAGLVWLASRNGLLPGNGDCQRPHVSGDGRFVVFETNASDLSSLDPDTGEDVYRFDRFTSAVELVSVTTAGAKSGDISRYATITDDGRYVVFETAGSGLVGGDTNGEEDIFRKDLATGLIDILSRDANGVLGDDLSRKPRISADGAFVAFESAAGNLTPVHGAGFLDAYIKEVATGAIELVSLSEQGATATSTVFRPDLSDDGKVISFITSSPMTNFAIPHQSAYVRNLCPAAWSTFGSGHPGTLGVPAIQLDSRPALDSTPNLFISNSKGAQTLSIVLGGTAQLFQPKFGGTLHVGATFHRQYELLPAFGGLYGVSIPDDPALCGMTWYWQALVRDKGASNGVAFTPGLTMTLGH